MRWLEKGQKSVLHYLPPWNQSKPSPWMEMTGKRSSLGNLREGLEDAGKLRSFYSLKRTQRNRDRMRKTPQDM